MVLGTRIEPVQPILLRIWHHDKIILVGIKE